jgi:drug/metabolite transporter (DMT)-like permease
LQSHSSAVEEPVGPDGASTGFEDLLVVPCQHNATRQHGPSKAKILLLVLAITCLHEVGNLALAWGLKHVSSVGVNPLGYITAMLNPFVAGGIVFLSLWMLTRMALMSWADLSFALPLMAVGYVVATVLGKFVLHENVGTAQWMGTLLIFAGSAVVGTTAHRTDQLHGLSHPNPVGPRQ